MGQPLLQINRGYNGAQAAPHPLRLYQSAPFGAGSPGFAARRIYAAWHAADGQVNETKLYQYANKNSTDMIAKGHCQAWILMAWSADAAILSDTYTFNAGMEYQGQNIGTELATEELCRKLTGFRGAALTDSVKIWCGTFGSKQTYTLGKLTATCPVIITRSSNTKIITSEVTSYFATGCQMSPVRKEVCSSSD
jgi:hypothetical protein